MSNMKFNGKTKLASAVSSAISPRSRTAMLGLMLGGSVIAPTTVQAQEAADGAIEEIVVTGIRASLSRAADIKRSASGVVDAISATDIGAFPDTNLAESLQRITGVSINRSRGEGSQVTVRGMGPEFNMVTLNGRQMPTTGGDGGDIGVSRSYDFANLASEAVAGIEVYKSGNADVPTGGIGSTINIKTAKPLESPGLKTVIGVKAVHDTSTEDGNDFTPEISGIYSNTFADDTIGIAITGSYQDRNNGVAEATTGDFNGFLGNHGGWGALPNDANQINRPGDSDIYVVPQSIGYQFDEYKRERVNGQVTLQWDASENLRATVDYTYSEVDLERTYNNYSAWFNYGTGIQSQFDDGPVASPLLFSEGTSANDFSMGAGRDGIKTENNSIGLNLDWQVNDRLSLGFDYHDSQAERGPNSDRGTNTLFSITSFTRNRTTAIFGEDLQVLQLDLTEPLSPESMIVTGSVFDNRLAKMEIEQAAVKGKFDLNDTGSIDFGVQLTDVENRSQFANVQRNTWGGTTQPGDIADLLTPASGADWFDEFSDSPNRQTQFFTFDIDALVARTEALGASQSTAGPCGTGLCASTDFTTDRTTIEESEAIYLQWNQDFELGNIPANLKVGLRYEETEVESQALVPTYSSIVQTGGNEFDAIPATDASGNPISDFTNLTGEYDFLLPNVDLKFDFTDNLVGRVSYSETVTRPNYEAIQGGVTISTLVRIDGGDGFAGNPGLEPFESENIDLSLEYYFDNSDYLSLGYFTKDVSNFIGFGFLQDQVVFPDLIHPATGGPAVFDLRTNSNSEDVVKIDGWELAFQYSFGETGFGMQANATIMSSDTEYNNASLESQVVLPGESDSANLVGFYENEKLQVRIAYNWRDDFYSGLAGANAGTPGPVYIEDYGQWDFSAQYDLNDNLTLFVEGINLTDETTRSYGRESLQTIRATQTGARYNFGARYSF